ncbi:MAG: diacylglycerol/polyprenol kinase family protein [Candidatus Peregrinibacteria bacterium]
MHALELRRQIIHLLYGPLLIVLFDRGILNLPLLFALVLIGGGTSYCIKHHRLSWVRWALLWLERPHHLEQFPARGLLFFTLGAFLNLLLFDPLIAYAGIMVLSVGDAVANIAGRHFGKLKTRLNPEKSLEGTVLGILVSIPAAYYFVPYLWGTIAAATVGMFLEIPRIRIFGFEIDDNLLIPIAASFTLSLFA